MINIIKLFLCRRNLRLGFASSLRKSISFIANTTVFLSIWTFASRTLSSLTIGTVYESRLKLASVASFFILSKLFFTIKLYSTNGIRLFTSVRCFSSSCASQSAPSLTSSLYLVKRYSFNFVLFFASNKYWCFFAFSINAASLCASFSASKYSLSRLSLYSFIFISSPAVFSSLYIFESVLSLSFVCSYSACIFLTSSISFL